jgi:hypothetical protein
MIKFPLLVCGRIALTPVLRSRTGRGLVIRGTCIGGFRDRARTGRLTEPSRAEPSRADRADAGEILLGLARGNAGQNRADARIGPVTAVTAGVARGWDRGDVAPLPVASAQWAKASQAELSGE